jgi:uncharacterized membrane protein
VGGAVAGLAIVVLPFLAFAPSRFFHEVIVVQVTRRRIPSQVTSLRLMQLLGTTGHRMLAVVFWLLLAAVVGGSVVFARRVDPKWTITNLDACAIACFLVVGGSFLVSAEFDTHYGGFLAPFLALILSATVVRLRPLSRTLVTVVVVIALCGFVAHAVQHVARQPQESLPIATIDGMFPASACVISETYAPLILADRYNLARPQCPKALDVYGTELTDGTGIADVPSDATASKLQSDWLGWLHRVDGLILVSPASKDHDLGPAVQSYLRSQFTLTKIPDGLYIYHRVSLG